MSEQALQEAAPACDEVGTRVLGPRYRVFLPQTRRDRVRSIIWSMLRTTLFRLSPLSMIGWRNAMLPGPKAGGDYSRRPRRIEASRPCRA